MTSARHADTILYICVRHMCLLFESNKTNPIIEMRRLQQLLQSRIIFQGDVLYFTFKKHLFTGKVGQGGLLWQCTWQKPNESAQPIFSGARKIQQQPYVRTFESLTDWTETCIQECLDEYHTRYSSWKRVRHQRTDQPMEVLFKHLQRRQMNASDGGRATDQGRNILLYEQIASQQHYIDMLTENVDKWKRWFESAHPGEALPVTGVDTQAPETPEPQTTSAQPFVLHSDAGQYMVLHRMNEVAPPECVSWLKENGSEHFTRLLEKIREPVVYDPVQDGRDTTPMDTDTSKRFVHTFFKNPGRPSAAAFSRDSPNSTSMCLHSR